LNGDAKGNEGEKKWGLREMEEKCPFYQGICSNRDDCVFQVWHYTKKECRKGGLLKTPKKLLYMEERQNERKA